MRASKRLFLKSTAVSLAGGLLASCGGGSSSSEANPAPSVGGPQLVEQLESLEPMPSAFDLRIDPFTRVSGDLPLRVVQDGVPLAGVPLQGFGADGGLIFSALTDAEGAYVWQGERTLAVRLVAQGPHGDLSIYDVEDPTDSLAPLVLNVLTTLADRVRLARGWLPSQADARVHQFCGIGLHTPLNQTFTEHPEFDHARFAQLREASGLSQDAFLNQLVHHASQNDFQEHALSFAPLDKVVKLAPTDLIGPVFTNALKLLDSRLSDQQKMDLFGGLLVDLGVLTLTDPVLLALEAIGKQLDDIQTSLNKLLEELRKVRLLTLGQEINALDKALTLIRKVMLGSATSHAKREDIRALIETHQLAGGNLPFLAVQAFLGGLSESAYDMDKGVYPLLFLQNNHIDVRTGGFEGGVRAEDLQRFFGREKQAIYEQALDNLIVLYGMGMAWAMMAQTLRMSEQVPSSQAFEDEASRLVNLARETSTFGNLLQALRPKRIPHDDVFFNLDGNSAWFVPRSWVLDNPAFYGGWHQQAIWMARGSNSQWSSKWASNLRVCHEKLPEEVKGMASEPWGPPSKELLDNTFFKLAGKRSVHDYAIAKGAASSGTYVVNVKGKPALNIWLSDLSLYHYGAGDSTSRFAYTYLRRYARLQDKDFRQIGNICGMNVRLADLLSAPDVCEGYDGNVPNGHPSITALGNYDNLTNYYYPSSTAVIAPEQYYPWHKMKTVLEATNGLRLEMVYALYAPKR